MSRAPDIRKLRWLDHENKTLAAPVVIGGRGASDFVRAVHLALGGEDDVGAKTRGRYSSVEMPPLRGFEMTIHLYGFKTEHDDAFRGDFWHHLAHTQWLVLSSVGPEHDRSWVEVFETLSRHLDQSRPEVVMGLHGPPELATVAAAAGLPEPVIVDARPRAVLKEMARHFLYWARTKPTR